MGAEEEHLIDEMTDLTSTDSSKSLSLNWLSYRLLQPYSIKVTVGETEQWWEKSTLGYSQPSQSGAEEEQLVRGGQRRSTLSEGGRGGAPSQTGAEEEHPVRGGQRKST